MLVAISKDVRNVNCQRGSGVIFIYNDIYVEVTMICLCWFSSIWCTGKSWKCTFFTNKLLASFA